MQNDSPGNDERSHDDVELLPDSPAEDIKTDSTCNSDQSTLHSPDKNPKAPTKTSRHPSTKRDNFFFQMLTDTELYKYLSLSTDVGDLKRRIALLIGKLGFSYFSFTLMGASHVQDSTIHSLPSEFLDSYYQNNYQEYDWLWTSLKLSDKGIFGSTLHDQIFAAPYPTEEVEKNREIIKLIKSFDYEDFYAIPAKSETERKGAFIIWGLNMSQPEFQDRIKLCEGRLELLCNAIDHICSEQFESYYNDNGIIFPTITARPTELLTYMAFHDCTLYQAAERMHISVKTANVHIASAKKALNVKTTTNAISLAIKHGLIKPE